MKFHKYISPFMGFRMEKQNAEESLIFLLMIFYSVVVSAISYYQYPMNKDKSIRKVNSSGILCCFWKGPN